MSLSQYLQRNLSTIEGGIDQLRKLSDTVPRKLVELLTTVLHVITSFTVANVTIGGPAWSPGDRDRDS